MSDRRHGDQVTAGVRIIIMDCTGRPYQTNEIIGVMREVRHGIRVGKCPTSRKAHED